MIEYMASSAAVGRRPRICRIRSYSSSLRPSSVRLQFVRRVQRPLNRVGPAVELVDEHIGRGEAG